VRGAVLGQYGEERTFIDIPGERLADFSLARRSYEEWSDYLLEQFAERRYFTFAQSYLRLVFDGVEDIGEEIILDRYKRVLAHFTRQLIPLVTPSTFLVHETGRYPTRLEPPAHEQSVEDLVTRRICGLDAERQFAPLPRRLRAAQPELASRFATRFREYRDRLAEPLGAGFSSCDQLLILVDVAAILESGPAVYHGTRQTLRLALEYLDPGSSAGGRLQDVAMRLLTAGRRGAQSVRDLAIIATKADCVHPLDRSNLVPLLKQMTSDLIATAARERPLNVTYFDCAAIKATEGVEYPWLMGYVDVGGTEPDPPAYFRFPVTPVPGEWPAESAWAETEFAFADPVPPPLDLLGRKPFPGLNMEKVTRFIGWPEVRA
jgi:uncharacterized protein